MLKKIPPPIITGEDIINFETHFFDLSTIFCPSVTRVSRF